MQLRSLEQLKTRGVLSLLVHLLGGLGVVHQLHLDELLALDQPVGGGGRHLLVDSLVSSGQPERTHVLLDQRRHADDRPELGDLVVQVGHDAFLKDFFGLVRVQIGAAWKGRGTSS